MSFFLQKAMDVSSCYFLFQLATAFSLTNPGVRTQHLQSMSLSELDYKLFVDGQSLQVLAAVLDRCCPWQGTGAAWKQFFMQDGRMVCIPDHYLTLLWKTR